MSILFNPNLSISQDGQDIYFQVKGKDVTYQIEGDLSIYETTLECNKLGQQYFTHYWSNPYSTFYLYNAMDLEYLEY